LADWRGELTADASGLAAARATPGVARLAGARRLVLLDHCPADYRGYAGWRKNPVALAWVAVRHIDAQLEAMRQAYREVRVDLGEQVSTEALAQIQSDLEQEGLRLRASARGARLLYEALQGKRYIPRL
jgi:hypothetical protein